MRSSHTLCAAALALGLIAWAVASLPGCGGGGGHLTASADALDFGVVAHGEMLTRSVRVKNEGRRGVVLTAAIPSCRCLVVDPSFQRSLQPDEETEIRIRLESGVVTPQKFQNKHLEVRSDDPSAPVLRVALLGEIQSRLTLVPTVLRVSRSDASGAGEPRRLKLRTPEGCTAEILKVTISQPAWFTVTPEVTPQGTDLLVGVTTDPTRRGEVDATIEFKVRVTGRGLPPQEYDPVVRIQGAW